MKIHVLSTADDNKAYFTSENIDTPIKQPLGSYSLPFSSDAMQFRDNDEGCLFPMHNAPRAQYIIYLEGSVQIRASGGETKTFTAGDILLVKDTAGYGHESLTLTPGRALIIPLPTPDSAPESNLSARSKL